MPCLATRKPNGKFAGILYLGGFPWFYDLIVHSVKGREKIVVSTCHSNLSTFQSGHYLHEIV